MNRSLLTPRRQDNPLNLLHREVSRFFDDWAHDWGGSEPSSGTWSLRMDVAETDDAITVKADIPGVDPKAVDITVDDGVLSLKGERTSETEDHGENYHRSERFHGTFSRSVKLPSTVDLENILAEAKDGVLTITLAKKAEAKPRQVEVNVKE